MFSFLLSSSVFIFYNLLFTGFNWRLPGANCHAYFILSYIELYKEVYPEQNPFVPRKFRMTINETAHQEEKDLRSKQSIQHLRGKIEIFILRSTNFKNQFRAIDERIKQLLESQTSDPRVRSNLFTLWENDCKTEENTSHKIWENDEKFLRSTYSNEKAEETNHTLLITQEIQTDSMNNN